MNHPRKKPRLLRDRSLAELKAIHARAGTKRQRRAIGREIRALEQALALPGLFRQIAAERKARLGREGQDG
jgi:hypothetical protein